MFKGCCILELVETVEDIKHFVRDQAHITCLLQAINGLGLSDIWIGAGLVRNAVWDRLHGIEPELVPGSDVDVVYCDHKDNRTQRDLNLLAELQDRMPAIPWSVHNQARMHLRNGDQPYDGVKDAISHWPETATAIAARWHNGHIDLLAPHGVLDLLNLIVRPTPAFINKMSIYNQRVAEKNWQHRWPELKILRCHTQ